MAHLSKKCCRLWVELLKQIDLDYSYVATCANESVKNGPKNT